MSPYEIPWDALLPKPITHASTCDRAKMASYHLTTHPSAGGPKDIRNQPVRLLTLTE